jgi:hypothetical protein
MIINNEPECDHEDGHDWVYDPDGDDSRQYWTESREECAHCGVVRIRRTEYGQDGLVESDEYLYEVDGVSPTQLLFGAEAAPDYGEDE